MIWEWAYLKMIMVTSILPLFLLSSLCSVLLCLTLLSFFSIFLSFRSLSLLSSNLIVCFFWFVGKLFQPFAQIRFHNLEEREGRGSGLGRESILRLYCALFCCAVLCCAVLCCAVLCFVLLYLQVLQLLPLPWTTISPFTL